MSQTDFQKLIEKALADESFAQTLQDNPGEALKSVGIDATPEILDAMQGVDVESLKNLASTFGDERAAL